MCVLQFAPFKAERSLGNSQWFELSEMGAATCAESTSRMLCPELELAAPVEPNQNNQKAATQYGPGAYPIHNHTATHPRTHGARANVEVRCPGPECAASTDQ